jgi:hypothetical protein
LQGGVFVFEIDDQVSFFNTWFWFLDGSVFIIDWNMDNLLILIFFKSEKVRDFFLSHLLACLFDCIFLLFAIFYFPELKLSEHFYLFISILTKKKWNKYDNGFFFYNQLGQEVKQ